MYSNVKYILSVIKMQSCGVTVVNFKVEPESLKFPRIVFVLYFNIVIIYYTVHRQTNIITTQVHLTG